MNEKICLVTGTGPGLGRAYARRGWATLLWALPHPDSSTLHHFALLLSPSTLRVFLEVPVSGALAPQVEIELRYHDQFNIGQAGFQPVFTV